MINAKEEFLEHIEDRKVKCALLEYKPDVDNPFTEDGSSTEIKHLLKIAYSKEDFNNFLSLLNFEYSHSFGLQYLFGVIWYEDGTWSNRGEYDGSEWWEYQSCPVIPDELN